MSLHAWMPGDHDPTFLAALMEALDAIERKHGPSARVTLDSLCALGQDYLDRGEFYAAESLFAQAVARSPSFTPAILGLARSLRASGDHEGAIVKLEDALRIDPQNEAARRELKTLLRQASRR